MYIYDITIARTGSIQVSAESAAEAEETIRNMSNAELETSAVLSDWERTDVDLLSPVEFYYQVTMPQKGQVFFRAFENLQEEGSIIALALDKGLISEASSCSCAVQHSRETYQSKIVDYLYAKMCREREEFRKWIESQPPEYIYNHCGDIQFYEDIIWLFEDFAGDEEFNLAAVEKLVTEAKPIEVLSANYTNIDFGSINNQLMDLINHANE